MLVLVFEEALTVLLFCVCVCVFCLLPAQFFGSRIIVGVDRLDPITGILHKIFVMEKLFEQYPEWIGKVVLVQIAFPSRKYSKLQAQVSVRNNNNNGNSNSSSSSSNSSNNNGGLCAW